MSYRVKSREADSSSAPLHADTQAKARDLLNDQRARGKTPWLEDTNGRILDETTFMPMIDGPLAKYFDGVVDDATRRVARVICADGGEITGKDPDEIVRHSEGEGPRWWFWVPAAQLAIAEIDGVRASRLN